MKRSLGHAQGEDVSILVGEVELEGHLVIPDEASGIVLFAHGSGSSRHSPRNLFVAEQLNEAGLATLLFDLLSEEEESIDLRTTRLRFDIAFLAERLLYTLDWVMENKSTEDMRMGLFGSSTGAAAALVAAGMRAQEVGAVVSRGGRPDLAMNTLSNVRTPTLLIVGGDDTSVIDLNKQAMARMKCEVKMDLVPHAGHLFEEPGALEEVSRLATRWFQLHL